MATVLNELKALLGALAIISGVILMGTSPVGAQPEMDYVVGIPEVMKVESVDRATGTVTLDGQPYRLADDFRVPEDLLAEYGTPLNLGDFRAGMAVLVITGGIEPEPGSPGVLLAAWRAE